MPMIAASWIARKRSRNATHDNVANGEKTWAMIGLNRKAPDPSIDVVA
jgi:hypothetical protein